MARSHLLYVPCHPSHRLRGICVCVCVCVCVRLDRLLAPCLEGGIAFPRCLMRYWDPRRSQRSIPCATGANGYRGATRWANGAGRPPCKAYVRSSQLSCTQPWQPDCEICFIKDFWQWKILRHAVSHHSMAYVDFHVMWDCGLFLFALVKFLPFCSCTAKQWLCCNQNLSNLRSVAGSAVYIVCILDWDQEALIALNQSLL